MGGAFLRTHTPFGMRWEPGLQETGAAVWGVEWSRARGGAPGEAALSERADPGAGRGLPRSGRGWAGNGTSGAGRWLVFKQPRRALTPRHGSESHPVRGALVHSPPRLPVNGAGDPRAARCGPGGRAGTGGGQGRAAAGACRGLRQRAGGVPQPAHLGAGSQPAGTAPVRLTRAASTPRAGARVGRWVGKCHGVLCL